MRDFDTSGRSSDAAPVFTPCPIHCQGYRRPIFPGRLATDTAPGLATDAQARRNISHYQFIVNTAGCLLSQLSEQIWGPPVCAGTTGGGGAPKRRRAHPGKRARPPISGPRRRESTAHPYRHSREGGNPRRGRGGWVPVSTGTTMGTHIVIPATGIHGGRAGDGFPSPRERRGHPHRHPGGGGNPRPHIVIPAKAGIHGGGRPGDGSPSPRGRRWASTSSFPRQAGIHGGDGFPPTGTTVGPPSSATGNPRRGPAMGPSPAGTTVHIVIPAKAGIHGGGPGDGFPSPRGRRWASTSSFPRRRESTAGTTTHIVIPAKAGIHGGGPGGDGFPSPRERRRGGSQVISE